VIGQPGQAEVEADCATRGTTTSGTMWQVWREIRKDPEMGNTLVFGMAFAKAFGRHQAKAD
jgi:hypothetical protein